MTTLLTFILFFSLNNNPPGTIKIKNYYIDRVEISNMGWQEYLYHQSQELDSVEMQGLFPDNLNVWYQMPVNRFKPIVLITYEQALGFCEWRSKVVSERMGKKVTYRLPTPAEWKDIAEELIKTDLKQLEKELEAANKMVKKNAGQYILLDREKPTSRIYNMFDNVSEMTTEKGTAMGSNNSELTGLETNLTRLIQYNSPNNYLGFRCIAEME